RGESQPLDARQGSRLADQARERVSGLAISEAAEVDSREHELAMALGDPPADLRENRPGTTAPRAPADERNDAEGTREGAAVLDLHERAHALESRLAANAADRADVSRDRGGRLASDARQHHNVGRHACEGAVEPGTAADDVHLPVRPRLARDRLAR